MLAVAASVTVAVAGCAAPQSTDPRTGGVRAVAGEVGTVSAATHPELTLSVAANGRHLRDATGAPFFWLADTAWSMPVNLDREQVATYLDARAAQGFTVIQTVAVLPQAGGPGPNRYGDRPFTGGLDELVVTDGADPDDDRQYDFWDHLDHIVAAAAARDLRVALWPVWGDDQVGDLLTTAVADDYGRFLGARYGTGVVWVLGGDDPADGVTEIWRALADGIARGATGAPSGATLDFSTTLMTYHPVGDRSSVEWFHDDPWLDLNMVQGGHCRRYDVRHRLLAQARAAAPARPFLDAEPVYESHPWCWRPGDGYAGAIDARRDAWWALLDGALGHSYGHHAVWQFARDDGPSVSAVREEWTDALDAEAAGQLRHLRSLAAARPWWRTAPAPELVVDGSSRGGDRVGAARAEDGSFALVYSPDGEPFSVDLSTVGGGSARLWWFDPRTGAAAPVDTAPVDTAPVDTAVTGVVDLTPPSAADWVLVVDDPAAGWSAPGSVSSG